MNEIVEKKRKRKMLRLLFMNEMKCLVGYMNEWMNDSSESMNECIKKCIK